MAEAKLSANARLAALAALLLLPMPACRGPEPEPEPTLLLLVSVDTLRADHLGSYGSDLDLTPHLDRLAAQSQVFEWAYAPTSFTLPSVSSLLTGRYPEEIGIRGNRSVLPPGVPTLASALRQHGWTSAAVVSNLVLHKKAGLAAGFDFYDDELPNKEATRGWPERIAAETTDAALAALDAFGPGAENVFLWVHYQDPHGPYTPPAGLRERFLETERARPEGRRLLPKDTGHGGRGHLPTYQLVDDQREVAFYRAGYAGEVRYLDQEVGRLLAGFESRGLSDRTVVVFTADHGESLGEGDYWFAHGDRLGDGLVRVPLLIRVPRTPAGRREDVAAMVDLAPTLLTLLTQDAAPLGTAGRDLFAEGARDRTSQPYLATLAAGGPTRFGLVADSHKLILSRNGGVWSTELFRLGDEQRDLAALEPARVERMRNALQAVRQRIRQGPREAQQELSDADRRNLRALGYLEGSAPNVSD